MPHAFQGRIRGVLAYKMGQHNVQGAYPFHFHHLGEVRNVASSIEDSAVFHSFFRGGLNSEWQVIRLVCAIVVVCCTVNIIKSYCLCVQNYSWLLLLSVAD